MERDNYDWLEFSYRPLKDGLHDSGYRYIKLVGVTMSPERDGTVEKAELHQWADHVMLAGITNIDVTRDGTIRLMQWGSRSGGWVNSWGGFYGSDAMFHTKNIDQAISYLETEKEIQKKVYGQ